MKLTFHLLIAILLFSSCNTNPFNYKISLKDEELIEKFGKPDSDTIVLSHNSELYEYQNGLLRIYKNLKPNDSILIIEKR